jgi:nicotinamidase/pyrazinamidase
MVLRTIIGGAGGRKVRAKQLPSLFLLLASIPAVLTAGCERATTGARIPIYDRPQIALLVLDLQKDFLTPSGRLPAAEHQIAPMLEAVNRLTGGSRALGVEVVYVASHFPPDDRFGNWLRNDAAIEGEPGAEIDPRVTLVNERLFSKERADAFSNPDLDRYLRSHAIDHVVLAGVFADRAVTYTARGARNRGYNVEIVRDAVAAADDRTLDHAIERLRREGAEVGTSDAVLAEWTRRKRYLASR